MAVVALILLVAWLVVVAGLRGFLHYRRTGKVVAPVKVKPGEPQWLARVIASIGTVFAFAAPVAELMGLDAIAWLDHEPVRYAGVVIAVGGIGATLGAQLAMGESWRPDVDPEARSPLVTTGPFRWVRNPVLTCMALTAIGWRSPCRMCWPPSCSSHSSWRGKSRCASSRSRTWHGSTATTTCATRLGRVASCLGSDA